MNLKCLGMATVSANVEISTDEFLDKLLKQITDVEIKSLEIKDDGFLYSGYDISYHGSPVWKYDLVTKDENKIALFKAILELRRCIKNISNYGEYKI